IRHQPVKVAGCHDRDIVSAALKLPTQSDKRMNISVTAHRDQQKLHGTWFPDCGWLPPHHSVELVGDERRGFTRWNTKCYQTPDFSRIILDGLLQTLYSPMYTTTMVAQV